MTLAWRRRACLASSLAWSSESLMPSMRMYSRVRCCFLLADLIGGAVEGDGETDLLRVFGELADLGDQTGGGDGQVACADVGAPRRGDDGDRGEQCFEIGERFAHAHEDDVVDALAGDGGGGEDLGGDFAGVEVAGEAGEPGGAEFAAVGAADLGGDAEGAAVGGGAVEGGARRDQDGFDEAAIVEPEQELARGVLGALGLDVLERVEPEAGGEFFAQRQGKIGDRVEIGRVFFPHPVEQLVDSIGRFTGGGEPGGEIVAVETWQGGEHGERLNIGY